MPWLHFYEKNFTKIEIVLFMLGLAQFIYMAQFQRKAVLG